MSPSRRSFLQVVSMGLPLAVAVAPAADASPVNAVYPAQLPEAVQELVVVAHFDLARVKELVDRQQTLAKATWDWGFGDWETALGAASHMGRRDIADVLLANGARPTLFSAAMLGQLEVVKAFIAAQPGIQRTPGPHSISLMQHAIAGGAGAKPVVDYLRTIDGAADTPPNEPLTEAELATVIGSYAFGRTPADRFEVTRAQATLQLGRPGHYPRGLFHLGSLEFCPMGAERVRIRVATSGQSTTLNIYDPDLVLTATKITRT